MNTQSQDMLLATQPRRMALQASASASAPTGSWPVPQLWQACAAAAAAALLVALVQTCQASVIRGEQFRAEQRSTPAGELATGVKAAQKSAKPTWVAVAPSTDGTGSPSVALR